MTTIVHGILEYDDEKNRRNIEVRGLPFELATLVFADPNRVEDIDGRRVITGKRATLRMGL